MSLTPSNPTIDVFDIRPFLNLSPLAWEHLFDRYPWDPTSTPIHLPLEEIDKALKLMVVKIHAQYASVNIGSEAPLILSEDATRTSATSSALALLPFEHNRQDKGKRKAVDPLDENPRVKRPRDTPKLLGVASPHTPMSPDSTHPSQSPQQTAVPLLPNANQPQVQTRNQHSRAQQQQRLEAKLELRGWNNSTAGLPQPHLHAQLQCANNIGFWSFSPQRSGSRQQLQQQRAASPPVSELGAQNSHYVPQNYYPLHPNTVLAAPSPQQLFPAVPTKQVSRAFSPRPQQILQRGVHDQSRQNYTIPHPYATQAPPNRAPQSTTPVQPVYNTPQSRPQRRGKAPETSVHNSPTGALNSIRQQQVPESSASRSNSNVSSSLASTTTPNAEGFYSWLNRWKSQSYRD